MKVVVLVLVDGFSKALFGLLDVGQAPVAEADWTLFLLAVLSLKVVTAPATLLAEEFRASLAIVTNIFEIEL